ncbi:MBL fold metallo-hydrolase [Blastomonas aquatica]|uniref:Phosphoribosyl 1,2-cyclic phosphodiesterase n=1 Tax=Blastomonas aquatica TaxID=1510276 RepID=A0ABQ1JH31_9SPHN|nr:MBL fold metallo-hydrolase [Blastomonas aquatica]GGB68808.1 phosphoribosyl 1,2-cyclic phosphodiesterase [Blastomonas aquatica]
MKAILLGSGTSGGVPRIGNDWGACDPQNPRNRRSRVSMIVEHARQRILIDTSPDLRNQLLAQDIAALDAVIWTHDHADHAHGIDDLRAIYHRSRKPLPGYGRSYALQSLSSRFDYVFVGGDGYPAIVAPIDLQDDLDICGLRVRCVDQPHGPVLSTGLRFDADGMSVVYATDFSTITDDMVGLYAGCDLLVSDCLRYEKHPTHASVDMARELAARCGAGHTVLTHMDKSLDYATLCAELPNDIEPGYDGLVIDLSRYA